MSFVEFLSSRINDDEAWAKGVLLLAHWRRCLGRDPTDADTATSNTAHWMLAECEAKRRIVERCDRWCASAPDAALALTFAVRTLAATYSDHPDYDDEWKP